VYGDVLIHREALEQALKGLLHLRERLDAWNKDESTLPYAREVKDLDWIKPDPISLDTVSTTMTAAKEVDDERTQAEADSWQ
jgi:hypothetical protein